MISQFLMAYYTYCRRSITFLYLCIYVFMLLSFTLEQICMLRESSFDSIDLDKKKNWVRK